MSSSDGQPSNRPTLSLKLATEADWDEVLRMAHEFHIFSPYNGIPFEESKVRAIFDRYLEDPTKVIVILGVKDGTPVGVIVGVVDELYFSKVLTAGEIIWWVDPPQRGTRLSKDMFNAFEHWGWKMGAKFLNVVNTQETTDLSRFYEQQGYHLAESNYVKELK